MPLTEDARGSEKSLASPRDEWADKLPPTPEGHGHESEKRHKERPDKIVRNGPKHAHEQRSIARSARDRSQPRVQEDRKGEGGWDEKAEAAAAKQSKQSRESDARRLYKKGGLRYPAT